MYKDGVTEINRELLTQWFDQEVPAPVLDCVVTVPVGQDGPGKMRQEGPAGATEQRTTSDEDPIIILLWNLRCLISMIVETMHAVEW